MTQKTIHSTDIAVSMWEGRRDTIIRVNFSNQKLPNYVCYIDIVCSEVIRKKNRLPHSCARSCFQNTCMSFTDPRYQEDNQLYIELLANKGFKWFNLPRCVFALTTHNLFLSLHHSLLNASASYSRCRKCKSVQKKLIATAITQCKGAVC